MTVPATLRLSRDLPVSHDLPANHNLPAALASFVGREEEKADLAGLLGASRLVTLVGTPGVGKTRLGLEVASQVVNSYRDGVWLIELGSVAELVQPVQIVALVLGLRERPGVDLVDVVISELRHQHLLLVFDNCEHQLSGCAPLAERLLRACGELTILATSREPLGITGEWVRRIEPLDTPAATDESYDLVVARDAVRLFAERGAATQSRFAMTPAVAPVVAEICRRLDGLPLAIELAAARLDVLSPAQILEQLRERFSLLRRQATSEPAFHDSLEAALDWSHNLLSQPEAALFRRLSAFSGGCTLEAALAVCTREADRPDDLVELFSALVRKSLVVAHTGRGDTRYCLLETIRRYAAMRLCGAGEEAAVRTAHCTWALMLAEAVEADFASGTRAGWLIHLAPEQDNFRTAFEWAMANGSIEVALRLGGALASFWWLLGQVRQGCRLLERAIAAGPGQPPQLRAKALWAAAFLIGSAGSVDDAMPLATESLALAEAGGDAALRDRSRNLFGLLSMYRCPAEALPALVDNVGSARLQGDPRLLGACLCTLAAALLLVGDVRAAGGHLEEALQMARRSGNQSLTAEVLGTLGRAALLQGHLPEAQARLDQALTLAKELGERGQEAVVLTWLGDLARVRGEFASARAVLGEALALAEKVGRPFLVARSLCFLGRVALAEGHNDAAVALLQRSLTKARRLGLSYLSARCLLGLGEAALLGSDAVAARESFEEALAVARANNDRHGVAAGVFAIAGMARVEGPLEHARDMGHRALTLQNEIGDLPGLASSLEMLAAIRSSNGDAVRLFAAAQALRDTSGCARRPVDSTRYDNDLRLAHIGLADDVCVGLWNEGFSMSVGEAVAYASRGRGVRRRPVGGWGSLTPAEVQVASLAAEGLTNREIGERLFVSPRTAGAHLASIFTKLEITSRRQLAKLPESPSEIGRDDRGSSLSLSRC